MHSLVIVATVVALAPVMSRIPVAALAGLLMAVALRMLSPAKLVAMYRSSRGDALTFAATFLVIVLVGLLEGVQWGIVAALAIAAIRVSRMRATVQAPQDDRGVHRLSLSGPISFLSSLELERVRERLDHLHVSGAVVLDLHEVTHMDTSGASDIGELLAALRRRDIDVVVTGLNPACRTMLEAAAPDFAQRMPETEAGAAQMLAGPSVLAPVARLALGVERFRHETRPMYADLFRELASNQTPHTLFITCADSRISPNLLTSTDPGELFVVRNVGNMIEPFSREHAAVGGADIEYAVGVLGVREIVVCAHSSCGAIRALSEGGVPAHLESLLHWVRATNITSLFAHVPTAMHVDELAKLNALAQLDHLRSYPIVRAKEEAHELGLHAWFFDIRSGDVDAWCQDTRSFAPLAPPRDLIAASAPVARLKPV